MPRRAIDEVLAKLPTAELAQRLQRLLAPLIDLVPDRRLQRGVPLAVRAILARESPVITQIAHSVTRTETAPVESHNVVPVEVSQTRTVGANCVQGHAEQCQALSR